MPSTPAEQVLIEKAATGDSRAFDALLRPYKNKMMHMLGGYFPHSGEREDAMQETLIRVFRGLAHFRNDAKFSTWLYTVTTNTARNELAKNKRHAYAVDIDELTGDDLACLGTTDGADDSMCVRQQLQAVQDVLATLPAQMAEALLMREVRNMNEDQIAAAQDCPTGTVRSRVFRARRELRERLLEAA